METIQKINDISHIWTRLNPRWLVSGITAGLFAGLVMLLVAAFLAGSELFYPAKVIGASVWGKQAMQFGSLGLGGLTGMTIHFFLSGFFGLVFAQFVLETSRKRTLLLLGALAGLAVWLFWSAMFMPSFNEPMTWLLPKTISLLLHAIFGFTFGLSLVTLRARLCR